MIPSINYLVILYFVSFCIMSILIFHNIIKNPNHYFFNIIQCMYVLIYVMEPFLVHCYMCYSGTLLPNKVAYHVLDYDTFNIRYFYYFLFFSWIGFFGLLIGNNSKLLCKKFFISTHNKGYSYRVWMLTAIISMLIGIIAELIWSRAYGGPIAIIKYASFLRDNIDTGIENPYTLFFRFAALIRFSNIVFFALACYYKRFLPFLLGIISLLFSIIYLLSTDGRASLVMHLVSVVLVSYISLRKVQLKLNLKHIVILPLIGIIALFFIHNGEFLSNMLTKGLIHEYSTISWDIFGGIRDEFAFTVRNEQAIFRYVTDHPYTFRFPLEIFSGILGIMPTSFRPQNFEMLGTINTRYWWPYNNQIYIGQRPPDLLVTGIYMFNWIGIFVFPFLLGGIIHVLDKKRLEMSILDGNIFFALFFYPVIRIVSYAHFNNVTAGLFKIFLGYILLWTCNFFINKILHPINR